MFIKNRIILKKEVSMKHTLLLATTFLAIATPAFGMQGAGEEEENQPNIMVIAHLNAEMTPRLNQEHNAPCRNGRFKKIPKDHLYDVNSHSIAFPMELRKAKELSKFKFSVESVPRSENNTFQEIDYQYSFGCEFSKD